MIQGLGMKGDEMFELYCQSWQKDALMSRVKVRFPVIWWARCTLEAASYTLVCEKHKWVIDCVAVQLVNLLFKMTGDDRWQTHHWFTRRTVSWRCGHLPSWLSTESLICSSNVLIVLSHSNWSKTRMISNFTKLEVLIFSPDSHICCFYNLWQLEGIAACWSYSHGLLAITATKMTQGIIPCQQLIFTVNPIWLELGISSPLLRHRLWRGRAGIQSQQGQFSLCME